MRILHMSTPKSWRGGEQQLAYLIEFSSASTQHFILCPKGSILSEKDIKNNPGFFFFNKKSIPQRVKIFLDTIKNLNPDAIHVHDSKSHTIALAGLVLSRKKIPLVVSRRVDFPIGQNAMSKWKYEHNLVSSILCVSKAIESICNRNLRRNNNKLQTVYDGVDANKLDPHPNKLRNELGFDESTIVFGCVAALAPHKDHATLLKAWNLLLESGQKKKLKLVLVGAPDGTENEVDRLISELKISDSVHVLGYRKDVHQILCDFDAFVISSKTEGLGTSIIDAMFAGLPVIATKAGGIPELVQDGRTGWLSEVENPQAFAENLKSFLNSMEENKVDQIQSAAKERAQKFSAQSMAANTEEVYRRLIAGK